MGAGQAGRERAGRPQDQADGGGQEVPLQVIVWEVWCLVAGVSSLIVPGLGPGPAPAGAPGPAAGPTPGTTRGTAAAAGAGARAEARAGPRRTPARNPILQITISAAYNLEIFNVLA